MQKTIAERLYAQLLKLSRAHRRTDSIIHSITSTSKCYCMLLNTPIVPSTRYGAAACRSLCLVCKWDRRDLRSTMVHIRHAGPSRWACSWPQLRRKTSGTRVWVLEYHGTSLAGLLARGTVHPSGPAYRSRQTFKKKKEEEEGEKEKRRRRHESL